MRLFICLLAIAQLAGSPAFAEFDSHAHFRALGRRTSLRQLINADHWVGIVGDSGVTGAASNPELSANVFTLLAHAGSFLINTLPTAYLPPGVPGLSRVVYSETEYLKAQAAGQLVDLNGGAKGSLALDVPEHGFGYQVARTMGIEPSDIVLVGQDGKRVSNIPTQLERLYEMDTATLPPLVFVSFTANDFCDLKILEEPVAERARRFARNLESAWEDSKPFLRAHGKGTEFLVLAPLEVANVLTNESLLEQEIPLGTYGSVTCRQMRGDDFSGSPVAGLIASGLIGMCPSVLGTSATDQVRVQRLRDVQTAFNAAWKAQIASLNKTYAKHGLKWTYVEDIRDISFTRGDVANDCFHPSASGHAKIADLILRRRAS